jgi:hypothetical protein
MSTATDELFNQGAVRAIAGLPFSLGSELRPGGRVERLDGELATHAYVSSFLAQAGAMC